MAKPKCKKIRADELWPGDIMWYVTGFGKQWGTFLVRVVNISHERDVGGQYVKLDLQTLGDGAPKTLEASSTELVEVFERPIIKPQPNFSVD